MTRAGRALWKVPEPSPGLHSSWFPSAPAQSRRKIPPGTSIPRREQAQRAGGRGGGAQQFHPSAPGKGFIFLARGGWEDLDQMFSCCSPADSQVLVSLAVAGRALPLAALVCSGFLGRCCSRALG